VQFLEIARVCPEYDASHRIGRSILQLPAVGKISDGHIPGMIVADHLLRLTPHHFCVCWL